VVNDSINHPNLIDVKSLPAQLSTKSIDHRSREHPNHESGLIKLL
jgi:hypothetical protein